MRTLPTSVSIAIATLLSGCYAHQYVGRPPTRGELETINAFAIDHDSMRVEYTDPSAPCAAGSCGAGEAEAAARGHLVIEPIAIEAADSRQITFVTKLGQRQTIPSDGVAGVSVLDRGRGAAVGAGVAAGVSLATLLTAGAIISQMHADSAGATSSCDGCWKVALVVPLEAGLIGALVGYLFGSRRVFQLAPAR